MSYHITNYEDSVVGLINVVQPMHATRSACSSTETAYRIKGWTAMGRTMIGLWKDGHVVTIES